MHKRKKDLKLKVNYLMMDVEDMQKVGITGCRLSVGRGLVSKGYDIAMIIIIVIYCLLMAASFVMEDIYFTPAM